MKNKIKHYSPYERNLLDEEPIYTWQDLKENGSKNPRANKKKRITDKEWLDRVGNRDNSKIINEIGSSFKSNEFQSYD